jgi:hypothetical protein
MTWGGWLNKEKKKALGPGFSFSVAETKASRFQVK